MSTTMWIVVPLVIMWSIFLILLSIGLGVLCYFRWRARCRRAKEANLKKYNEKLAKEKEKQKEATKLTRMQLEMEEIELGKMYANNQTDFSITPSNPDQPNIFIVPGATVEPSHLDVNPYSGHHNNRIIPSIYDTKCYGVTYDTHQNIKAPHALPFHSKAPLHALPFHRKAPPINPDSVSHSSLSKSDSLSKDSNTPNHSSNLSNQV